MLHISGTIILYTIELDVIYDIEYNDAFYGDVNTIHIYADEEAALAKFDELNFYDFFSKDDISSIIQAELRLVAWELTDNEPAEDFDTRAKKNLLEGVDISS